MSILLADIETLNSYGQLVSRYLSKDAALALYDREQLKFIISELSNLFINVGKLTLNTTPDKLIDSTDLESPQEILKSIEEIRFRMVGVLLGAGLGKQAASPELNPQFTGALTTERAGITWCNVGRTRIILMPAIDEQNYSSGVTSDLAAIYETATICDHWVIDCSAVKSFSTLFFAVLLGYKNELRLKNVKMSFVWLAKQTIPDGIFEQVERLFELEKFGEFFFSRSI